MASATELTVDRELQERLHQLRPPFEYEITRRIAFSNNPVYLAVRKDTNESVAVKKIALELSSHPDSWEEVHLAIKMSVDRFVATSRLDHPNIVRHLGLELDLSRRDEPVLWLLMEYCHGGTLSDLSRSVGGLSAHQIKPIARQIISGLEYLYANGICHLDLKGANIVQGSDGSFKICDFGEIVKLASPSRTQTNEVEAGVGTVCYMAPEMANSDHGKRGRAADVYSFGCVLIEMMTGKMPQFRKENGPYLNQAHQIQFFVGSGGSPEVPREPAELVELVRQCIQPEPKKRPSVQQLSASFLSADH